MTDFVLPKPRAAVMWRDYLELTKPRIVAMVTLSALTGGLAAPLRSEFVVAAGLLSGVALLAGGVNALNQYLERDFDARMTRTRMRPLPTRRLTPRAALVFAMLVTIAGIVILSIATNALTTLLGAITAGLYLLVYTPMKRQSEWCVVIGAIPGAMPPLMGWTASMGTFALFGWILFALLFLWQLPHFMAISWIHRADYCAGGFVMSSGRDDRGNSVARQTVAFTVLLLLCSIAPYVARLATAAYGAIALLAGITLLYFAVSFATRRDRRAAVRLFAASNLYLVLILGALVATAR